MKILVTGAAGFIGFHLCKKLIIAGHTLVGLDNINNYYNPKLKLDRLVKQGFEEKLVLNFHKKIKSNTYQNFYFQRSSLEDSLELEVLFKEEKFDVVCNLAAQVGVRNSIENPSSYVQSNIVGFLNLLECSKKFNIKHLVYASSSSVYGLNKKVPFKASDRVDSPISLYAVTKRTNELMAHTYSHLYKLPTTGLRFFTVYGPWGRPDMAMFLFTDAIVNRKLIKVFNKGEMERDFTYVDDIVNRLTQIIENKNTARLLKKDFFKVYNIGNNTSIKLLDFVEAIEDELGVKAKKQMLPMQPGDVKKTWANVDELIEDYGDICTTSIKDGVKEFILWYKSYYLSN